MTDTIPGRAGAMETAAWPTKHPALGEHAFGPLGETGLTVSRAGFGGYRVHDQSETQRQALRAALQGGINLIDTSANYTDGGSERAIGGVLREMINVGLLKREEVVVVSKAGYIQGENWVVAAEREREGRAFPEVVKLGPDLWHCIHPDFLEDQITRALQRLRLKTIDVFLLHNPEYYLEEQKMSGRPIQGLRDAYHDRIARAFAHLESEVKRGSIARYGISSNTFVEPSHDPKFTSLERCWETATSLNADHQFRVVQMPGNLVEAGLAREKNQSNRTRTVLEFAGEAGLGVLINRPLNAFTGYEMVRLADSPRVEAFRAELTPLLPAPLQGRPLSQIAIWALAGLPQVSCVLVGMRREAYVADVFEALRLPRDGAEILWPRL